MPAAKINKADVVKGLQAVLPLVKMFAQSSGNKYALAAVAFLETLLAADNPAEHVAAVMQPGG